MSREINRPECTASTIHAEFCSYCTDLHLHMKDIQQFQVCWICILGNVGNHLVKQEITRPAGIKWKKLLIVFALNINNG